MSRFFSIVKPVLILGIWFGFSGAQAHEFWIQPHEYRIGQGDALVADVRVGVDFRGNPQAYTPQNYIHFNTSNAGGTQPVEGRVGDMPAVNITPTQSGLQVVSLFSTTSRLTWDDFQKFEAFVALHGMPWVLEEHAARGLPETGFREAYTRFVKTLVAVGEGAGRDHYTGMFFELVAAANPYTDDVSGGMPITVMFKGVPLAGKQVDLFYRNAAGELSRLSVITGRNGRAVVPNLGAGEYMVNAVHMIAPFEADIARTKIVWHSLWGSITYRIGA